MNFDCLSGGPVGKAFGLTCWLKTAPQGFLVLGAESLKAELQCLGNGRLNGGVKQGLDHIAIRVSERAPMKGSKGSEVK